MIQKVVDELEEVIKEIKGITDDLDSDHRDYEYYSGLLEGYENSLNIVTNQSY